MASIRSGIGENMEDRYLFKAKRTDNREWVIGNLIQGLTRSWISSEQEDKARLRSISNTQAQWRAVEVDLSTLCQCTGLKDETGKLIWENDIIRTKVGTAKVIWDKSEWRIEWLKNDLWRKDLYYWAVEDIQRIVVIGNIFGNKELLESEKK